MISVIDLNAELAKLHMLRDRTPETTRAEREGSAAQLAVYRDGSVFTSKFAGKGAWECHAAGEELVQIVDGTATLDIVTDAGPQSIEVRAGMMAIVPRGVWHRFRSPEGVTVMTVTPTPSEHVRIDVDDPRTVGAQGIQARP